MMNIGLKDTPQRRKMAVETVKLMIALLMLAIIKAEKAIYITFTF